MAGDYSSVRIKWSIKKRYKNLDFVKQHKDPEIITYLIDFYEKHKDKIKKWKKKKKKEQNS